MTHRPGTLGTLGARLASFTSILAVGSGLGMILAVIRIAVLTRLLDMPIYGQFTLLVIFAGFVALLCRMAVVTGTILTAFRGGEDDSGDEEEAGDEPTSDPRHVLGTGLVAALTLTAGIALTVAVFYGPIDEMLLGSGTRFPIVAAALLGGLDATFHLVATITRFERRPVAFVILQLTNAALGIAVAAFLIQAGFGLNGAIGGLALGTVIALVPGLWISRHRFALSLSREHLEAVVRKGAPFVLITGGYWLYRHADILMVSRYLSEADVALYRVAARVGAITSTFLGAVLLARGPLLQGPMRGALHRENLLVAADSRLVGYIWFIAVWMLVGLLLARDLLVRVAPPDYGTAATLIPLLGFAALATSGLTVIHRTARMKRKKTMLITLLMLMSPLLVALSIVLIPALGLEGAAIASIIPPVMASSTYLGFAQKRGKEPLQLPWNRMLWGVTVGVAYSAAFVLLAAAIGPAGIALSVVAALAFPGALVLSGALPREEARRVLSILPVPRRGGDTWMDRIAFLDYDDVNTIEALLRRRESPRDVAQSREMERDELLTSFVAALRELGEFGAPREGDHQIGKLLVSTKNAGLRAREGERLAKAEGVKSVDVDRLNELAEKIGGLNQKRWEALTGAPNPVEGDGGDST